MALLFILQNQGSVRSQIESFHVLIGENRNPGLLIIAVHWISLATKQQLLYFESLILDATNVFNFNNTRHRYIHSILLLFPNSSLVYSALNFVSSAFCLSDLLSLSIFFSFFFVSLGGAGMMVIMACWWWCYNMDRLLRVSRLIISESNSLSPSYFANNGTSQKGRPRKRKLMINQHHNDPLNLGTTMQMGMYLLYSYL